MDSIIESTTPWRTTTELAVATNAAPEKEAPNAGDVDDDEGFKLFGNDGFTFLDFLDIINPLQHFPVIGTLYRELTGDTLDPGSRVLGGTLFLGPVGTVVSLANVLVDDATGRDMGEHVMSFFENEEPDAPGAEPAKEKVVADIGARAGFVQPETSPAFQPPGAPGAIDPVTAWARSEVAFRHSAVGGGRFMPAGETESIEGAVPAREKAAAPEPVTTGALAPEAQAPGFKQGGHQPIPLGPSPVGEIHQDQRVVHHHANQGQEPDQGQKGDRDAHDPVPDDHAQAGERNDEHDHEGLEERAKEGAENEIDQHQIGARAQPLAPLRDCQEITE